MEGAFAYYFLGDALLQLKLLHNINFINSNSSFNNFIVRKETLCTTKLATVFDYFLKLLLILPEENWHPRFEIATYVRKEILFKIDGAHFDGHFRKSHHVAEAFEVDNYFPG